MHHNHPPPPRPRIVTIVDYAKPPKATLCWKQSPGMVRCDRRRAHLGPHSWQLVPPAGTL